MSAAASGPAPGSIVRPGRDAPPRLADYEAGPGRLPDRRAGSLQPGDRHPRPMGRGRAGSGAVVARRGPAARRPAASRSASWCSSPGVPRGPCSHSGSGTATRCSSCSRAWRRGTRRCLARSGSALSRCRRPTSSPRATWSTGWSAGAGRDHGAGRCGQGRPDGVAGPKGRAPVCWTDGGEAPDGWLDLDWLLDDARDGGSRPIRRRATTRCCSISRARLSAYPKMVLHTTRYGLGHLGTARYWHDLRPDDLHWTVTDPGWAKAAWSTCTAVERARRRGAGQPRPARRGHHPLAAAASRDHVVLRPADALPPARADRPDPLRPLALRHCTSAGEPLNAEVLRVWADGTA